MKFKLLNELDKSKYILDDGYHCPYCRSKQITGQECVIEGTFISRVCSCEDCMREWRDIYTLNDVEDITPVCRNCHDLIEDRAFIINNNGDYIHKECEEI